MDRLCKVVPRLCEAHRVNFHRVNFHWSHDRKGVRVCITPLRSWLLTLADTVGLEDSAPPYEAVIDHNRMYRRTSPPISSHSPKSLATADANRKITGMAVHTLKWNDFPPPELTGGCVTIGNFDGVHRGHARLVATANDWAKRVVGPAVAVTFDPPPVALLNPAGWKLPLGTLADRTAALIAAGADHVVYLKTDASLLALSAEAFFEDVLLRQLGAKAIVEGYNFHFGRGRGGNTATLRTLCAGAGIAFEEVPPLLVGGEPVSSSRVRAAVNAGDVALAAELLGRPYRIAGEIVTGAKRGRTIGFPTANLDRIETLLPAVGVYAVRATVNEQVYAAAANIGPNPTFGEDARKVEIHLIDFTGDVYGKTMGVEFAVRLRDTKPFASVAELVEQLQRDVADVRQLVGEA